MKAIVLCGGLGTRLGALTRDTPKPLIEVAGQPFLTHVLAQLRTAPVTGWVLAVSFQWEKIRAVIGDHWQGLPVQYAVEAEPLGTGGAIRHALAMAGVDEALVANGDSLIRCDAGALVAFGQQRKADIAMTLKAMPDCSRFGRVLCAEDGRVEGFAEKGVSTPGHINAGLYWLTRNALEKAPAGAFSFEREVLSAHAADLRIFGLPSTGYFIDMGIPEDLARARVELAGSGPQQ